MELAKSLVSNGSVIHLFTDYLEKKDAASLGETIPVYVHNYAKNSDNVSLLSFGTLKEGNSVSAIAVVQNQTSTDREVTIQVKNGDAVLFSKVEKVEANGEKTVAMQDLPIKPYYEAKILVDDDYELDNHLSVIQAISYDKVYAVGEVNPFFIAGLETIGLDVIQVDSIRKIGDDGMVLAEGIELNKLGGYPLLYMNHHQTNKLTEAIKATDDGLLTYVESEKIYIQSAAKSLNQEWEPILTSGEFSLIEKGMYKGQPIITINFSLKDSDWPLQPSFPLFLYNSYQWLTKQSNFLGYFQPGEEKSLQLGNVSEWNVFTTTGKHVSTWNMIEQSFKAPNAPGIYEAVTADKSYYLAVLLDDREKSLVSADSFSMNNKSATDVDAAEAAYDQLWFWLACVALILLMLEWEVYRRGY